MGKTGNQCSVDAMFSSNWRRKPKASTGVWLGDGRPQVQVAVTIAGTKELVLRSGNGPAGTEDPLIGECALAVCLRAAAVGVKAFRCYLPSRTAGGFLPFAQVVDCKASCVSRRRVASEKIAGVCETVFDPWQAVAVINIAHSKGVSEATIRELIATAGIKVGLGLHSPHWKGSNGTFVLSSLVLTKGSWPAPGAELAMLGPVGEKLGRGESIDFIAADSE